MKENIYSKNLIAIDPGISGTGVAHFVNGIQLKNVYTITPNSKMLWMEKVQKIHNTLVTYFSDLNLDSLDNLEISIEMAVMFGGAMGRAVAMKGDLPKLSMLTGVILGCAMRCGISTGKINLIAPTTWKGQLTKQAGNERVLKILNEEIHVSFEVNEETHHAIDAIGIGLFTLGLF